MKKICLISWYNSTNYGTNLQAYALETKLRFLGYDVAYLEPFSKKYPFIKLKLNHLKKYLLNFKLSKQEKKFEKFRRKFLTIRYIKGKKDFYNIVNQEFDLFMTGSDQLWNPNYFNTFYLLDWVKEKKKVAYSTSFGVSEVIDELKSNYCNLLSKFSYLGIREESGVRIVKSLLPNKLNVQQVLDPTFLLNNNDWNAFIKDYDNKELISKDYILCYILGNRDEYENNIIDIYNKSGIKNLKIIKSAENPLFTVNNAVILNDCSPVEFIYLLLHAKLVITDSFHATALCINNKINFIDFLRFSNIDKKSQNIRLIELLKTFKLENQIYSSGKYVFQIDFFEATEILRLKRKDSEKFLIDEIED